MNKKSFIWLIPVLVMALAMSGCGDSNDGDGGGVTPLKFQGDQVWQISAEGAYVPYDGDDIVLTSNAGQGGAITKGELFFTIEKPIQTSLKPMGEFLKNIEDKFKIFSYAEWNPNSSTPNAMELVLSSASRINLSKANFSSSDTSKVEETVMYIYVDRDCTLAAASRPNISITGVSVPVTVSALNLSLKEGWNTIKTRMETNSTSGTAKIETGDSSSCMWILTAPAAL